MRRGHSPPQTLPQWGGRYPSPLPTLLGACGTSTPPILKSWVRHWAVSTYLQSAVSIFFYSQSVNVIGLLIFWRLLKISPEDLL